MVVGRASPGAASSMSAKTASPARVARHRSASGEIDRSVVGGAKGRRGGGAEGEPLYRTALKAAVV